MKHILEEPTFVNIPDFKECLTLLTPKDLAVMKYILYKNSVEILKLTLETFQDIQIKYDVLYALFSKNMCITMEPNAGAVAFGEN